VATSGRHVARGEPSDLRRHAADFSQRTDFTFTVLEPVDDAVIGCVYVYPSRSEEYDVTVHSWVREDKSDLDVPLADVVARWLATDWPWERVDRPVVDQPTRSADSGNTASRNRAAASATSSAVVCQLVTSRTVVGPIR